MFLHIGADIEVPLKDIITIFDNHSANYSKITQEFLHMANEEEFIRKISNDPPKSIVVTEQNKKSIIYLSPISSTTLQKRIHFISNIAKI